MNIIYVVNAHFLGVRFAIFPLILFILFVCANNICYGVIWFWTRIDKNKAPFSLKIKSRTKPKYFVEKYLLGSYCAHTTNWNILLKWNIVLRRRCRPPYTHWTFSFCYYMVQHGDKYKFHLICINVQIKCHKKKQKIIISPLLCLI